MLCTVSARGLTSQPWQDDQEIDAYKTANSALSLQDISFGPTETTLLCDTSTGQPSPIVPRSCVRKTVFDVVHGLSHPSIRETQKLIRDRHVWKGVRKEVAQWVKTCIACQESSTLGPHPRFLRCHNIDLITFTLTLLADFHHHRAAPMHLLTMHPTEGN